MKKKTKTEVVLNKELDHVHIEDQANFDDLQETREFKRVFIKNGKVVDRIKKPINEGLSTEEVEQRKKEGLVNKYRDKNKKTIPQIIFKNFFTFLNILLYSIGIALLICGAHIYNCFFLIVITSNLVIGIVQEIRAKAKMDKLALLSRSTSKVIRNGEKIDVSHDELVLDDICLLVSGNKINSDSKIIEGVVEVNESLLTGESLPQKKGPGDHLFAGSFISSGSCYARVERVGEDNYVSKLQDNVKKQKQSHSEMLVSLNRIIKVVSIIIIPAALIQFFVKWWGFGFDMNEVKPLIINGSGSMVAMIPSGLFLTVSITLFYSMIVLAGKKALVQDTYSVEAIARINCLCLDKTGTITDGTMRVYKDIVYDNKYPHVDILVNLLEAFEERNVTATSLLNHYKKDKELKIVRKIPFSSERKKTIVEFKDGIFALGAKDYLLDKESKEFKDLIQYEEMGYRVLVLVKGTKIIDDDLKGDLELVSAYILKDHVREEAYDTIKWFQDNEVEIKIITGDNPLTASIICKELEIKDADKYVSLEGLSKEEVAEAATIYTVFGRVSPEQKAILVTALKKAGKVVGMTGDGVNDILAMKLADCSIAMASGSEASRNVAQLVLAENNFSSMPEIVKEGRRVINNIQSIASLFLMKTFSSIVLTFSTLYPFEPRNLMILEIAVIGLPGFFLALQPNHNLVKGKFINNIMTTSVPAAFGIMVSILLGVIFTDLGLLGIPQDHKILISALAMSFTGLAILFKHCSPFNKYRVFVYSGMILIAIIVTLILPLTKNFNLAGFNTYELTYIEWAAILIITTLATLVFLLMEKVLKKYFEKHEPNKNIRKKVTQYEE